MHSFAQQSSMLEGRWKMISLTQVISADRDSLYYDFETDSIHIPAEELKEAYKDGLDSISTVNLFKSMYGSFKGSRYTFSKDSVVFENQSGKTYGTYKIVSDTKLEMTLAYLGEEPQLPSYNYLLKQDFLMLLINTDLGYYKFILKKV
jgi:hypothetical protein